MPSLLLRNGVPGSALVGAPYAIRAWLPPEDDDFIAQAQNTSGTTLLLNGAGVKNLVTNSHAMLPRAASPTFTFSASTDTGYLTMKGLDQWMRPVLVRIFKPATGTVVKTIDTTGNFRLPSMSFIESITMEFSVAAGTVKCGFNFTTGTVQTVTLEQSVPVIDNIKGVWGQKCDGLFQVAVEGAHVSRSSVADIDGERGCVGVTLGTTAGISLTGATFTNATLRLTKTSGFTAYKPRAGDYITVSGGTGVTTGTYPVLAKIDNDTVILNSDMGGTNPSDVAGTIVRPPTTWSEFLILMDPSLVY